MGFLQDTVWGRTAMEICCVLTSPGRIVSHIHTVTANAIPPIHSIWPCNIHGPLTIVLSLPEFVVV